MGALVQHECKVNEFEKKVVQTGSSIVGLDMAGATEEELIKKSKEIHLEAERGRCNSRTKWDVSSPLTKTGEVSSLSVH